MRKHVLTAMAGMFALSMFAPGVAQAQEAKPHILNIGTVAPKKSPWGRQLKNVAKRIKKQSEGRIKVRVFYGTAGGEKSIVRQVKSGQLQGGGVSTGALATLVPELNVFELPYLFDNAKQADNVIDNHLFKPTEKLLASYGYQLYIFSENGFRNFAANKCINAPGDLGGIPMRAQKSWVHEETYRKLGGEPKSISVPEVLEALRTNNVKGFDNTALFAMAAGWYSHITHWTVSDHIYQPAMVVYNKKWFDSMPKDLQEILLANRKGETESGRKYIRKLKPKLMKNLAAAGKEICKQTPAQRAAFKKKTKSVHKMFRKRTGKKGSALLDLINKNK